MSQKKLELTIELVPGTAWFQSLYNLYVDSGQSAKWRKIKEELFIKEGRQCFICGEKDTRLEAHEFWYYDNKNNIQKLMSIHHLCSMCHKIKHFGFWCYTVEGEKLLKQSGLTREDLVKHFCEVNSCTDETFEEHWIESYTTWEKRSEHEWVQDLGEYDPGKKFI